MKQFYIKAMTLVIRHLTIYPSSSHPGYVLTVHCNGGFLEEHIHGGDSGRCASIADPDVHDHTEPQLGGLVAQRRHFICPLSSHCSRHAIEGGEVADLADAASALFDVARSDPISYTAIFPTGTGQRFTLHQPRGLTHTLGLTVFVHHGLAHLETYIEYNVKITYLPGR